MLNSDNVSDLGRRYLDEYLRKGGYVVNVAQPGAGETLFIEAEKFNKKYIFSVKTVVRYSSEPNPKGAQDFSHEEKRSLITACAKIGAIAMRAIVEVYGDTDKEGLLIPPIRFKRV